MLVLCMSPETMNCEDFRMILPSWELFWRVVFKQFSMDSDILPVMGVILSIGKTE